MIENASIPVLLKPTGFDIPANQIINNQLNGLSWLTNAYKHSEILENEDSGKFPAVYVGAQKGRQTEYLNLFPDENLGNFSFIRLEDGVERENDLTATATYKGGLTLVYWFDFRKVYPDNPAGYSLDNVIEEVLEVIKDLSPRLQVTEVIRQAENIYKGLDHNHIKRNFLQRPYGGFGLKADFIFRFNCAQKAVSPSCLTQTLEAFRNATHASQIGGIKADEYYCLSSDNDFGLPEGLIMQMSPTASYSEDALAISLGGIKNDQCFALSSDNVYGLPEGAVKMIPSATRVFYNDTLAAANGVPKKGLYLMAIVNNLGLVQGLLKKRVK